MIIFRNDDVTGNTDPQDMFEIYEAIRELDMPTKIISCVSVFSRSNVDGSVYPEAPFKDKPLNWFYNVNQVTGDLRMPNIASHGLFHIDHTKVKKETQCMSILGSCNYLQTDMFVPPFNRWNEDTKDICAENGIKLIGPNEDWKSLEFNDFDPDHKYWYFHSWRYTVEEFRKILCLKPRLQ